MTESPSPAARRIMAMAVSDTGFVFDPHTGHSYTANATALCVLSALKQGLSCEAAAAQLRERFSTCGAEVEHDVQEFLRLLRDQGLLPPAGNDSDGAAR